MDSYTDKWMRWKMCVDLSKKVKMEKGKSIRQIADELEETPDVIQSLYDRLT